MYDITPPEKSRPRSVGRAIAKGAMAGTPFVGGFAAEFFDVIILSEFERRRQAWESKVTEMLTELEGRPGVDVSDPRFITFVTEASKIAVGTHLETKLDMLKACLTSCALPADRNDFIAVRYLRWVDEFTAEPRWSLAR